MNSAGIVIGIALIAIGVSGICLITIPSIENIGHQASNVANSNSTNQTVKSVVSAGISGFFLWLTTGILVVILIGGVIAFIWGLVD